MADETKFIPIKNCIDCGDSMSDHALYSYPNVEVDLVCEKCHMVCWNQAVLLHPVRPVRKGKITQMVDAELLAATQQPAGGG